MHLCGKSLKATIGIQIVNRNIGIGLNKRFMLSKPHIDDFLAILFRSCNKGSNKVMKIIYFVYLPNDIVTISQIV